MYFVIFRVGEVEASYMHAWLWR